MLFPVVTPPLSSFTDNLKFVHRINTHLIVLAKCVCLNGDENYASKWDRAEDKREKVNSFLSCEQMPGSYVLSQRK